MRGFEIDGRGAIVVKRAFPARNTHANGVLTHILRPRATKTITIKAGHWVGTTTFQFCSQNIRRHKKSIRTANFNHRHDEYQSDAALRRFSPCHVLAITDEQSDNANPRKVRAYKSHCQRLEKACSILLHGVWMRA